MSLPLSISVYFTLWWITLFAILPFGVRSQNEDPSAAMPAGVGQGRAGRADDGQEGDRHDFGVGGDFCCSIDAYAFWMG